MPPGKPSAGWRFRQASRSSGRRVSSTTCSCPLSGVRDSLRGSPSRPGRAVAGERTRAVPESPGTWLHSRTRVERGLGRVVPMCPTERLWQALAGRRANRGTQGEPPGHGIESIRCPFDYGTATTGTGNWQASQKMSKVQRLAGALTELGRGLVRKELKGSGTRPDRPQPADSSNEFPTLRGRSRCPG